MHETARWQQILVRNGLALLGLLMAYYIPDRFSFWNREGFARFFPYLMLLLLFGWIVFHNRILFGRLFLRGKKRIYFVWTFALLALGSVNMHLILVYGFNQSDTLPKIVTYWVFTLTGLGVYVIFLYLQTTQNYSPPITPSNGSSEILPTHFTCMIEGEEKQILLDQILYVESLENYVKINTLHKVQVVRLSLKETEAKLPRPRFLRISRSHVVNTGYVESIDQTNVKLNGHVFKIGKVYKRYVQEQLAKR